MFKQLYYHNDKAFLIVRRISLGCFDKKGILDMGLVKGVRDWFECDHVLKTSSHFLFVETIEDIEFEELIELNND
jgi:hypothetical protein